MISALFKTKKPFIGFITGGDGGVNYSVECALQMIEGGVDMLEIGLPFSDPVADGPVIQKSSQRALAKGMSSQKILEMARQIKQHSSAPLILFSYFNPLLQLGDAFLVAAKSAGFDALLVVDFPPMMGDGAYYKAIRAAGLSPILLASPSTDTQRLHMIADYASDFIYYACQKGTTGVRSALPTDFSYNISRLRLATSLPIVVGFGIADRQNAETVLAHADGFVVGSAFVNLMGKKAAPSELKQLAQAIDPR